MKHYERIPTVWRYNFIAENAYENKVIKDVLRRFKREMVTWDEEIVLEKRKSGKYFQYLLHINSAIANGAWLHYYNEILELARKVE